MPKKVIFDCDNTMGIQGCDVDDGLALLYLLGHVRIELCGITTTYGNSDIDSVYTNTSRMLDEIGYRHIPLLKGCPDPLTPDSEAVDYLIQEVNKQQGDIAILATGSLTNLKAAYQRDPSFFTKVSEIVVMGGITEELKINGKILDELNFSCDPEAAEIVLKMGRNISVITGNNCLNAFFEHGDFIKRLAAVNSPLSNYINDKCKPWFQYMMELFNINGFYNWDIVAAVYLTRPLLFTNDCQFISPLLEDLNKGYILHHDIKESLCFINLPKITQPQEFAEEFYQAWGLI